MLKDIGAANKPKYLWNKMDIVSDGGVVKPAGCLQDFYVARLRRPDELKKVF